jgi:NADH:ubiquinone oxidoreductase subunit K
VLLGKDVFAAVITAIRGISAITGGKDLEVSVGLGMFLSDYSIAARTAIDSVNVFDLWFVGLVGYAIETTGTVTRRQAVSVVGASWLVLVAFRVALATMLPS